jgi:4-carboxymuconolactone decarboxylase
MDYASYVVRESGVTEEQLRDLPGFRESEHFSDLEKLVLEYAEAMTRTPAEVPEELFDALREHLDERQLVELTTNIAIENYRSRFNNALGIEAQGWSESQYCVRPEGARV